MKKTVVILFLLMVCVSFALSLSYKELMNLSNYCEHNKYYTKPLYNLETGTVWGTVTFIPVDTILKNNENERELIGYMIIKASIQGSVIVTNIIVLGISTNNYENGIENAAITYITQDEVFALTDLQFTGKFEFLPKINKKYLFAIYVPNIKGNADFGLILKTKTSLVMWKINKKSVEYKKILEYIQGIK